MSDDIFNQAAKIVRAYSRELLEERRKDYEEFHEDRRSLKLGQLDRFAQGLPDAQCAKVHGYCKHCDGEIYAKDEEYCVHCLEWKKDEDEALIEEDWD